MTVWKVSDRETISSVSSSTGFTAGKLIAHVLYAIIQAIDGNVRFTIDGTIPESTLGLRLLQNASVEVWGVEAMNDFRCIDDGGTAKLEVVYMSRG